MGPLPRADLARNASKSSGLLGMDSLSVALEDLEETARTFREKSRPLLDNGDGKLMESGLLSETVAVVDDEERARTKRKKLMRGSRGQRGRGQEDAMMQTQGAPALAGMAHSRAKLDRKHPGAIPDDDLEEAPLLSLPVVETLCARLDSADNIDPVENRASAQSPTTMTHGASGVPTHESCNPRAPAR